MSSIRLLALAILAAGCTKTPVAPPPVVATPLPVAATPLPTPNPTPTPIDPAQKFEVGGMVQTSGPRGPGIAGATIVFMPEKGGAPFQATSSERGAYRIDLPRARYRVQVTAPEHLAYSTDPGFVVVGWNGDTKPQTSNFFLEPAPK